jgi:hypothetical protein
MLEREEKDLEKNIGKIMRKKKRKRV